MPSDYELLADLLAAQPPSPRRRPEPRVELDYEHALPGPFRAINQGANWFARNVLGSVPGLGPQVEEALDPEASLWQQLQPALLGGAGVGVLAAGGAAAAGAPFAPALASGGGGGGLASLLASEAGSSAIPGMVGRGALGATRFVRAHPKLTAGAALSPFILKGFAGSDEAEAPAVFDDQPIEDSAAGSSADMLAELLAGFPGPDPEAERQQTELENRQLQRVMHYLQKGLPGRQAYGIVQDVLERGESRQAAQHEQLGEFANLALSRARGGASLEQLLPELMVRNQFAESPVVGSDVLGFLTQLYPQGVGQSVVAQSDSGLDDETLSGLRADIQALRQSGLPSPTIHQKIADAYISQNGVSDYLSNQRKIQDLIDLEFGY